MTTHNSAQLIARLTLVVALLLAGGFAHASSGVGQGELTIGGSSPRAKAIRNQKMPSNSGARDSKVTRLLGQSSTVLPDGRLLLTGGQDNQRPISTMFLSDSRNGTIEQLPLGLVHARSQHTATVLPNGTVLILGGIGDDGQVVEQPEIFDPSDLSIRAVAPSGLTPRAFHTATLLTDGRLLIVGGISHSGATLSQADLWDYRTPAGANAEVNLRVARSGQNASLLSDGTVLICAGIDGEGHALTACEIFYPSTSSSQIIANAPQESVPTLPSIASSIPEDGAANVPLNPLIGIRYSKLIALSSLNTGSITLHGPQGEVPIGVVGAEDGRLAFVTPLQPLIAASNYSVGISGAVDDAGTPLPDSTIRFTTKMTDQDGVPVTVAASGAPNSPDPFNSPARKLPPLQAPKGVTAISGQVLQLSGDPLKNTTLQIGNNAVKTDETGRFLLSKIPSGHQVMWIDGSTAHNGTLTYGIYEDGVDVIANQTNVLSYTIWMTALDTSDEVTVPSAADRETIVSTPLLPGLELHLPVGAVIRDRNDNVVTKVGITPIPINQPPFPLPKNVRVPIYFTIQPGGAYLEGYDDADPASGARLFYPNSDSLPPNSPFNFWDYDADSKGWYVYGQGFVTADKKQVVPNPGVVIYEFTGAMVGNPGQPVTGPNGAGGNGGDPVDLQTGLFVYSKTDLAMSDVIPIQLTRTYRQMDPLSRAFGIGTMSTYDIYLVGDGNTYTYIDLIQPSGGKIHFDRVSAGTGWTDAVFENLTVSTPFYSSQIVWNGNGWTLTMKSGTKMYFPESSGATYFLNAALIGVVDRYGNSLTLARDGNNNLTRITSPNGRWIQYTYDTSNRVTQATDSSGRNVYYTYDGSGHLLTVKDANGGITTFGYDANNNMTTIKDPRNITYLTNHYDSNNMVDKQTMADGTFYQFHYVLNAGGVNSGYVVQGLTNSEADVTDPRGNVRKVYFNADGFMSSETWAFGKPEQQTITYNRQPGSGLLMTVTDSLSRQTAFAYDALGNTTSVTRLAGTSGAVTTTFTYEPQFNQMSSSTDVMGRTVSFNYDNIGNIINITNPDGTNTIFASNTSCQLTSTTDAAGNTTNLSYSGPDVSGITDPLQRKLALLTDEAGRTTAVTDARGQTTQVNFDSLNEVTKVTDPMGGSTLTSYDPNGNLISVTDAKNTQTPTVFAPDSMDRLNSETDQLGNADSSIYDPNGNLVQYTDRRGKLTVFQYDALNRLTFKGFGTQSGPTYESTISYTWDAGNRLTQVTDSLAGTSTLGYDSLDRLTSVTSPQGSVAYTYDAIGRRQTMTVAGQSQVTYSYDAGNRVTQISQGGTNVQFGYDVLGRRTTLTLPNGIVASYTYDAASQLTSLVYSQGLAVAGDLEYTFDAAGHRSTVSGSMARTGLPQPQSNNSYNAANQLTQFGSFPLAYDLNGNLTSDGLHTYTWDARDQLINIDSGGAAAYAYDAFGRRIGRGGTGITTTNFLYDGLNPVQELNGASPTANLLTGGVDEYLLRTDANGSWNLMTDALGSTLALADASGTIQTQYSYDPFGGTTQSGASTSNSFGYTGREIDATGLYYYRARYYSPTLQRFINEDPIGMAGGINVYAYAGNDPLRYTDPTGTSNSVVHIYESYEGAREAGWGVGDSVMLGFRVAAVDYLQWMPPLYLGTQGTSASDANQHAMSGQLSDGTYQTRQQAYDGTANFVRNMAGRKDKFERAMGLHAVQDSYSGSHDYQEWHGHAFTPAHQIADAAIHREAIDATRDYLLGAGASALNPIHIPSPVPPPVVWPF